MSNYNCCCGGSGENCYSVKCVCGEWVKPEIRDKGQCFPLREKRYCGAPAVPAPQCGDETYVITATPDGPSAFQIEATLYDNNCEPILDEDGNVIKTIIT